MYRNIKHDRLNLYCRYLDIGLINDNSLKVCNGRFGNFLKKYISVSRFPYGLRVLDLIKENALKPNTILKFPKEYFINWENFPKFKARFSNENMCSDVGRYSICIFPSQEDKLEDFLHLYDTEYKSSFIDKYKIDEWQPIEKNKHSNGASFYSSECYFQYWKIYPILETLDNCKNIEKWVSSEDGKNIFIKEMKRRDKYWTSRFEETFNRLSLYVTLITFYNMSSTHKSWSYGEISKFILSISNCTKENLHEDLIKLVEKYIDWKKRYEEDNSKLYQSALRLLKRDIYYLYEIIAGLCECESEIIEDYPQIKTVIDFEEHDFKNTFITLFSHYATELNSFESTLSAEIIYNKLESLDGFYPWIRAFHDMHEDIESSDNLVEFRQPRILDNLLVLTIRTEIIIRMIFQRFSLQEPPYALRDVIKTFADLNVSSKKANILLSIADKEKWRLTELNNKPENIFGKINASQTGKNWSKEQKHYFSSILKLVTSRNYFAHHNYKDDNLNIHTDDICLDVLKSSLHSIAFFINFDLA
ncbi:hypothetical protein [Sessilibacter corallicola]|uniref:hypothetical protein n=1 Tax=Sessilibacter corallicola TaxID=2904075 RepID=UPI001E462C0B|nr:hypothetical protein [Sessilibacter corallicola]MCE2029724.1 hypothetical protein [Sessilibacter corallicola]